MKYAPHMTYIGDRERTSWLTIGTGDEKRYLIQREHLVRYTHGLRGWTVVVEQLYDDHLRAHALQGSGKAPVSTSAEWQADAEEIVRKHLEGKKEATQ